MPAHAAANKEMLLLDENKTVDQAIKALKKARSDYAIVTSDDHKAIGVFSYRSLLSNLLPVQVEMSSGEKLTLDAAPGAAKRLAKAYPLPIYQFMDRALQLIIPDAPLWDALKQITDKDAPLVMIEPETHKPLGVITYPSLLAELERMQKED